MKPKKTLQEVTTKQGVRNLDHLLAKPRGRTLPEPPIPIDCKHRNTREVFFMGLRYILCNDCDRTLDDGW